MSGIKALPAVLVVEDETLVRMAIVDAMEDEGFVVFEAADAANALRLLAKHPAIRLIFTDIDLPPGINGFDLVRVALDRWPPLKVIVTSGLRGVGQAQMPAMARFFAKPYSPEKVMRSMRELLAA